MGRREPAVYQQFHLNHDIANNMLHQISFSKFMSEYMSMQTTHIVRDAIFPTQFASFRWEATVLDWQFLFTHDCLCQNTKYGQHIQMYMHPCLATIACKCVHFQVMQISRLDT